ncbi:MAG: hypothetical protein WBD37_12295 [Anderseniella sp.]
MTKIIELSDYRDITPKEDEIRLPEDGFLVRGISLASEAANENDLINAHKWFSLAAMRGSHKARVQRLKLSQRMSGEAIMLAQREAMQFVKKCV